MRSNHLSINASDAVCALQRLSHFQYNDNVSPFIYRGSVIFCKFIL